MDEIEVAKSLTHSTIEVIEDSQCLANKGKEVLAAVRDMKQSKIAQFELAASSGSIDRALSDGIVGSLETEIAICDVLLDTDLDNESYLEAAFGKIKDIVRSAPAPGNQLFYNSVLSPNEAALEAHFARTITELQRRMRR